MTASAGPKTILVVDNNRVIVEMIADYLSGAGYRVEKAFDGMEALEKSRRIHPDAVILDLIMPKIDGMRVCRYLKEDEATARIPVIILSGTAAEEQVGLAGTDLRGKHVLPEAQVRGHDAATLAHARNLRLLRIETERNRCLGENLRRRHDALPPDAAHEDVGDLLGHTDSHLRRNWIG